MTCDDCGAPLTLSAVRVGIFRYCPDCVPDDFDDDGGDDDGDDDA